MNQHVTELRTKIKELDCQILGIGINGKLKSHSMQKA